MTHRGYTDEEIAAVGLTPSIIRLSIGLEHQVDLIADIEQALSSIPV
jgi:cystathionine beta-lyase/cystathionine gamma-synthase